MNKKGLSDVITNVLIILIVIVSVGIIAAFIFPLLKNSTSTAGEGVSCLSVDISPVSCTYLQFSANSYNANVSIKRGSSILLREELGRIPNILQALLEVSIFPSPIYPTR